MYLYADTWEKDLILLLSYTEISMIAMSLIHTGSLMIFKCAPLPDKRGMNDCIAAVVLCGCFNGWPRAHLLMTMQIRSTLVKIKLYFPHAYLCMLVYFGTH